MQIAFAPDELRAVLQPIRVQGGTTEIVRGIAGLGEAGPGDLSFLSNSKYRPDVAASQASVVILPDNYEGEPGPNQMYLRVANPSVAVAQLCIKLEQSMWPRPPAGIHPSAVVDPAATVALSATIGPLCVVEAGARIGDRCYLQAQNFIGRGAVIGADCWLMAGSLVATECVLGDRVRLQPGAIVGADGFGYDFVQGKHVKIPQVGTVVLGDDVEIGSNTTLDRARFSSTFIGEGSKLDNLVQVGHNVKMGKHCLIVSQAGIAGSTTLEDYVVLGGQVGVAGHLVLGKGVQVGAQSGINTSWPGGTTLRGTPALPYMEEQRITVLRNRLPDLFKRVAAVEKKLA
jgi:UDP-3-O-[3-hydroxymyristoyl] glucosamine N-acyltransferase